MSAAHDFCSGRGLQVALVEHPGILRERVAGRDFGPIDGESKHARADAKERGRAREVHRSARGSEAPERRSCGSCVVEL